MDWLEWPCWPGSLAASQPASKVDLACPFALVLEGLFWGSMGTLEMSDGDCSMFPRLESQGQAVGKQGKWLSAKETGDDPC